LIVRPETLNQNGRSTESKLEPVAAPWICLHDASGHTHNQTHLRAELREAEDSSGELAGAADVGSGSLEKRREGGGERSVCGMEETRRRGLC